MFFHRQSREKSDKLKSRKKPRQINGSTRMLGFTAEIPVFYSPLNKPFPEKSSICSSKVIAVQVHPCSFWPAHPLGANLSPHSISGTRYSFLPGSGQTKQQSVPSIQAPPISGSPASSAPQVDGEAEGFHFAGQRSARASDKIAAVSFIVIFLCNCSFPALHSCCRADRC